MNQRNLKKIKKIKNSITVLVTVIFLFLVITPLFSNKTIVKEETTKNNLKALDQEGENYRLVTSSDNVQVPVPKGYVASQIEGENYVSPEYSHTTNIHKVQSTSTVLTWSSPEGEQYPWTQDENGIWISGNKGVPNSTSTLESEEFNYINGTLLTIFYTYSCQTTVNSDYLDIDIINLTDNTTTRIINRVCGNTSTSFDYTTSYDTYTIYNWVTGRYKIRVIYSKNGSINGGQDSAYIKPSTYFKEDENGTETFEEDIKTKIHDGGFVIYQLTDEELETDPNGTNIVINDINKDTAQSTRNQYVWVPLPNIEDIVRIKIVNNRMMQFGQGYQFSTTSITKITNMDPGEPRLVEQYDKTKYYLPKYSNLNKRESYLNNMQEDFTRMIKSINKYKGFYIGRYETGDDYTHGSNRGYYIKPKVVRYNENINYVTWYDSYKDLERLSGKTEEYVETGMIYDCLLDYTLKWLNETDTRSYGDIAADSGTWGNYANNKKIVTIGNTYRTNTGAIEKIIYKGGGYSNSPTSSNNIFDIAGNVWEWNRYYGSDNRNEQGGSCSFYSYDRPSSKNSGDKPYYMNDNLGTRAQLYIL